MFSLLGFFFNDLNPLSMTVAIYRLFRIAILMIIVVVW